MPRRRWWAVAMAIVLAVAVAAALVWAGDDEDSSAPTATTTTTTTTTTSTTTTAPTTTTSSTTTTPVGPAPEMVTGVTAGTAGGSGEVQLTWNTVADATGYRVIRSDAGGASLGELADVSVTTGQVTAADDVVNIWSDQHTYLPAGGRLATPDTSARISYVDVGPGQRCFRVVAYNDHGEAAPSAVACGSPP